MSRGTLNRVRCSRAALSPGAKRVLRQSRTSGYSTWSTRERKHLDAARHPRQDRDARTAMEVESRTTHGVQLQLGMPLLLRRGSRLRQVRDGPRLPDREGQLRRGRARRIEIHPRRGMAEGDPPGTRPRGPFPRWPSDGTEAGGARGDRHREGRRTDEHLHVHDDGAAGGPDGADRIPVHRQTEPVPHRGPGPRGIRTDAKPRDRRGPLPDRPAPDGFVHEERGVLLGEGFPRCGERVRVQLSRTKRDPRRLDVAGPDARETTRLRPVATARDAGFELSTRLHCTYVIVPLPRGPPDDEPSRKGGEQPVTTRQVDVERHFEPSTFLVRDQPVCIVRVPHVRAAVGLPTVRRPQVYKKPRDEGERHDSGLFHLDQVSLPAGHLACAQPDSAQFGVVVPKFRAPGVDIRKRGSKPLRQSEEHVCRIRRWHKNASASPSEAFSPARWTSSPPTPHCETASPARDTHLRSVSMTLNTIIE